MKEIPLPVWTSNAGMPITPISPGFGRTDARIVVLESWINSVALLDLLAS
jgi:hypothetical protein